MHIPVLLAETVELMYLKEGETVVDGTLGSGGHASEIGKRIGKTGVYVGLDVDADALERGREKLKENESKIHLVRENFRHLDRALADLNIREVDAVLFDLGWSTDQFETSGRGFSFGSDEPLIMTLEKDSEEAVTARDIVNSYREDELADLIYTLGEEQFSRRIAGAIVEARKLKSIETTKELVAIIEKAVPKFYLFRRIHPATKTFQALRIKVNDELGALREGLEKGLGALKQGGRFAVITFHSLEDRIVKQTFREWAHEGRGSVLTKKPIVAGAEEIQQNKRARSAKLRGFKKV
jgi:16S rRNA (cytosine1402-N4)-methyltransferase